MNAGDSAFVAMVFFRFDLFQNFSWWVYLGAALIYSAFAFTGEWSKDGPLIFSKRNARPLQVVVGIHTNFLIVLLLLLKVAVSLELSMPNWMTRDAGRRGSPLDLVFIFGMLIMGFIERRLLYVESDADMFDSEQTSSRKA